jgi:hypothetical protein
MLLSGDGYGQVHSLDIVTLRTKAGVRVLTCLLWTDCDTWSSHSCKAGYLVDVHSETVVAPTAWYSPYFATQPSSLIGTIIPGVREACAKAVAAHEASTLPWLTSVGWDCMLTPEGTPPNTHATPDATRCSHPPRRHQRRRALLASAPMLPSHPSPSLAAPPHRPTSPPALHRFTASPPHPAPSTPSGLPPSALRRQLAPTTRAFHPRLPPAPYTRACAPCLCAVRCAIRRARLLRGERRVVPHTAAHVPHARPPDWLPRAVPRQGQPRALVIISRPPRITAPAWAAAS